MAVRVKGVSSAGATSVGCEFSQVRVQLVRVNGGSSTDPPILLKLSAALLARSWPIGPIQPR
eukprot:6141659-Pyramimonas_sp.AAC.1